MEQNEFHVLTDLLRRLETEVPAGTRTPLGDELVERIISKVSRMVNVAPGIADTRFLQEMEIIGYPMLPLQQDLVSVHLYGINTTKGMIQIPTTAMVA